MLLRRNIRIAATVLLCCIIHLSCTRKWDDHNQINEEDLQNNLYEKITAEASLSTFAGYLDKSGYADTLRLNKSFTVWAPTNDALKSIDASLMNDAGKLKTFVAHHIARLSYLTGQVQTAPLRLPLLDGKYVIFKPAAFEDVPLASKDKVVANGVLHTITAPAAPRGNNWDYIDSLRRAGFDMALFMRGLSYKVQDLTNAVQTGIDPLTGEPIYQPGTDSAIRNQFLTNVHNVNDESKEYTVFIMGNVAFDKERAKLDTFYRSGGADTTRLLANWNTAKDLLFEGALAPDQLPDSLQSRFGVWVPINKAEIRSVIRTSNGYVYVMNDVDVKLRQRILPYRVEGENYTAYSVGGSNPVYLRTLNNPNTGEPFKDLFVYNHGTNKWYVRYRINNVYTTTYKVYWATYNNRYNNTLNQRLAIGAVSNTTFPYRNVPYNIYSEEYLGEFSVTNYDKGYLDLYLVSADIAPSSSNMNQNSMFLDYIRLEPVFKPN